MSASSVDRTSVTVQIQEIYIGLLGRAADQEGLQYWEAEINAGILTIEQLRANIVNEQPEYIEGIGKLDRPVAVIKLYKNLFGRSPEPEGLEYWTIGGGASVNFDQLVLALINGASEGDRAQLDQKILDAQEYTEDSGDDYDPIAAAIAVGNNPDIPETVLPGDGIVATPLIDGFGGPFDFGTDAGFSDDATINIDLSSIFESGIDFFGQNFTSININSNGNLTFGAGFTSFTPSPIDETFGIPIIAPFFADVDVPEGGLAASEGGNSTGSNRVFYTLDQSNQSLIVTWDDVRHYNGTTNLQNAFQVIITNIGNEDFSLEFRYEDINWTTGDSSGGAGGLGGTVARAGFSGGNGALDEFFELPGAGVEADMLALDEDPGNTGQDGRWLFYFGDGTLDSDSDDDLLVGLFGYDTVLGGGGDDLIDGGALGAATLNGESGSDTILGSAFDDVINGGSGADNLSGSGGNDVIDGGSGSDVLRGGDNDDILSGASGNDSLFGDGGSDVFVFGLADGADTVEDFENGVDQVDLSEFGFADFAAFQANAEVDFGVNQTNITIGDDSLVIMGLPEANLDASDFIF